MCACVCVCVDGCLHFIYNGVNMNDRCAVVTQTQISAHKRQHREHQTYLLLLLVKHTYL